MSPEQLEGKEADPRSDIFAFGCVLYELLSGKLAFEGASAASVTAAILERPAPYAASVAPPALDRALQRCLAKDPDDRWQTVRDLRAELQWIATAPPDSAPSKTAAPRLRYMAALLLALSITAAVLGAAWWLRRPPVTPPPRLKVRLEPPAGEAWSFPTLSPDGTGIAFSTPQGLRVRAVDSLETQWVTTMNDGRGGAAWSPDGSSLVYYTNAGELGRVSLTGGTPQTLAIGLGPFRGATWNTDGTILFGAYGPITRTSENGGAPVAVTAEGAGSPTMLPDGRHFLFLYRSESNGEDAIYAASLDSKVKHKITEANSKAEYTSSGHLLFLRGVTLMAQPFDPAGLRTTGEAFPVASDVRIIGVSRRAAFSAAPNGLIVYQTGSVGRNALTWFDRSGKPGALLDDANTYSDIELAPDGKSVAAVRTDPKTLLNRLWVAVGWPAAAQTSSYPYAYSRTASETSTSVTCSNPMRPGKCNSTET